jgi:hypothetical protein
MNRALVALVILVLTLLACRVTPSTLPDRVELYPSATPNATQTALVIVEQITTTPEPTQTPNIIVLTQTPNELVGFCVSALVAVHLRPSPSVSNYPIQVITNGTELVDLGGRSEDGQWAFVALGQSQGWVNLDYLERDCG